MSRTRLPKAQEEAVERSVLLHLLGREDPARWMRPALHRDLAFISPAELDAALKRLAAQDAACIDGEEVWASDGVLALAVLGMVAP